jgi:hypothetical protein
MRLPARLSLSRTVVAIAIVASAAVAIFSWTSEAAPVASKPAAQATQLKPAAQLAQVNRTTDLKVDGIFDGQCKCDLADVDALYMSRIAVTVSNNYQQSGGAASTSLLTVTYFDLKLGRQVTQTKNLSALSPHPTNPWVVQETPVVTSPVLIKKSAGIRAEVKPTSPGVTDSNLSNNAMVEHDCKVMVY